VGFSEHVQSERARPHVGRAGVLALGHCREPLVELGHPVCERVNLWKTKRLLYFYHTVNLMTRLAHQPEQVHRRYRQVQLHMNEHVAK